MSWPTDVKVAGEVNNDGLPNDPTIRTRLSRVCGLTPQQRVWITLDNFDDQTEDNKKTLFDECVQAYVVHPEELKDKAMKLCMKMISHA